MSKKPNVPDAWDDDWEVQADQKQTTESPVLPPQEPFPKPSSKVTKAHRRAQQAEFNRQLWEEAEAPNTFHFLESRQSTVPLKSDFKPAMKVLSRKPNSTTPPSTGLSHLNFNNSDNPGGGATLEVGDDDSDEEDSRRQTPLTAEERAAKAQREREEKQKKYEEVRERLFGTSTNASSGTSTPGDVTPPKLHSQGSDSQQKGKNSRSRGGGGGGGSNRPSSAASAGKPTTTTTTRQLYDPSYTLKPDSVYIQKREKQQSPQQEGVCNSNNEQQPIRAPRGPDGSGRGGFGFATRGGKGA